MLATLLSLCDMRLSKYSQPISIKLGETGVVYWLRKYELNFRTEPCTFTSSTGVVTCPQQNIS